MLKLALFAVLFSGCVHSVWRKPNTSDEAFKRENYECARDARITVVNQYGGSFSDLDRDLYNQCMESRGWALREVPGL